MLRRRAAKKRHENHGTTSPEGVRHVSLVSNPSNPLVPSRIARHSGRLLRAGT